MDKIQLTIGISAYNEAGNIGSLISSILGQKDKTFNLKQIVIVSDGSTDATVRVVRSFKNPKIKVLINDKRKGLADGLNKILKSAKNTTLVTLDADTLIYDTFFIQKLITPIFKGGADLTSSAIYELKPRSYISKILFISMRLKDTLFKSMQNPDNIYSCHGLARAYSRDFITKLRFPTSVGNDMYSYLACKALGLKYKYVPRAIIYYKLPETFSDHKKQSTRFYNSENKIDKYFADSFVRKELNIGLSVYLKAAIKSLGILLKYPIHSLAYLLIQTYLKLTAPKVYTKEQWSIASSTK